MILPSKCHLRTKTCRCSVFDASLSRDGRSSHSLRTSIPRETGNTRKGRRPRVPGEASCSKVAQDKASLQERDVRTVEPRCQDCDRFVEIRCVPSPTFPQRDSASCNRSRSRTEATDEACEEPMYILCAIVISGVLAAPTGLALPRVGCGILSTVVCSLSYGTGRPDALDASHATRRPHHHGSF